MEEYMPNSYRSKEQTAEKKTVVEKVISGKAKVRKKSEVQRLTELFISKDVENLKTVVVMDILVPAIKKMVSDIITDGTSIILYGESGKKSKSTGSKVSYSGYYDKPSKSQSSRSSSNIYDFDNLLFDTKQDADSVLDSLQEIIDAYEMTSVADLYDLSGVSIENSAAGNYGWRSIIGAKSVRVPEGWILKLPRPIALL